MLAVMALLLLAAKDRFQRKASLLQEPFSTAWIIAVAAALISSLCLTWLSYRDVEFSNQMWWHFAFHADAPRSLRAMVLATMLTGMAAAWLLLRPARHLPRPPQAEELERARGIIEQSGDTSAWLAMLGDKNLLFSDDGRGFVMYRPVGRNWIAMGDPVGPPEVRHELLWRFREACDRYAARPVFYQAGVEDLPAYIDAGFVLSKIGEEARVPLTDFSLEGSQRADLRQGWRRVQRQEVYFEMLTLEQVAKQIGGLRAVSDAWLEELSTAEKGFSLGHFEEQYIKRFPCAVVKRDGAIVAFANMWLGANHGELSVDLMRYYPNAPKGVMDYLMVEIMLWGTPAGLCLVQPRHGAACRSCGSRVRAAVESRGRIPLPPRRALLQLRGAALVQGEVPARVAAALPRDLGAPGAAAHGDGCGEPDRRQPAPHRHALIEVGFESPALRPFPIPGRASNHPAEQRRRLFTADIRPGAGRFPVFQKAEFRDHLREARIGQCCAHFLIPEHRWIQRRLH